MIPVLLIAWFGTAAAQTADPPLGSPTSFDPTPPLGAELLLSAARPPLRHPRPALRMARASDTLATVGGDPMEAPAKRRSPKLLLGALGAELAAGALLGGAALTRDMYLDPARDPGVGLYRTNRILGHAGYASAVAGGALALGSLSMWEW